MSVLLMCYCSVVLMCYYVLFNSASQQVSCAVGSLLGCHNYAVRLGNVPLRLPSWLSGKAAPVPSAAGCCIGPWHLPLLSWWPYVCVPGGMVALGVVLERQCRAVQWSAGHSCCAVQCSAVQCAQAALALRPSSPLIVQQVGKRYPVPD